MKLENELCNLLYTVFKTHISDVDGHFVLFCFCVFLLSTPYMCEAVFVFCDWKETVAHYPSFPLFFFL